MAEVNAKNRLVFAVLKFLEKDISSSTVSEDSRESLEVAAQCIQSVYSIEYPRDGHLDGIPLEDLFQQGGSCAARLPLTRAQLDLSELKKTEGNDLMCKERFGEAIAKYSEAIEIDDSNKVFYCNRAAAFGKVNEHMKAVDDCKKAISLDQAYGKAYRRMGRAYAGMNMHNDAVASFQKALDIEPESDSCRANLEAAIENRDRQPNAGAPGFQFNMQNMLSNPDLFNVASSIMTNPSMQSFMSQIVGGMSQGGAADPNQTGGGGMANLIRAGQEMAQQFQQNDPELIERLRNQMQPNTDNQNPPGGNSNT